LENSSGGQTAGIYPKGSASKPVIDKIMQGLKDDGTLKKLEAAYLLPSWGGVSPDSIPTWKH
jgi:polar amino acid transport system substrate-binding protein